MRIAVISPPKSGNNWIKCLLGQIYGLVWLSGEETPAPKPEEYTNWVAQGGFPEETIFHQHVRFSPRLADAIEAVPARIVTIVRDPYDTFVSLYHWVQARIAHDVIEARPRPRDAMIGKPLDHPDVLAYLADGFGTNLVRASGWLHSGRAVVVHYEALHRDGIAELTRATDQIAPVRPEVIVAAVDACRADRMRQLSESMAWHVRSATVGESRETLGESHLAVFRARHAELIRKLGYEVR